MSGQSGKQNVTSVRICIMRHGMAENTAPHDALRELVTFGERQAKDSALWFKRTFPSLEFDHAVVSPFIRARQTFHVVEKHLSVKQSEISEDITPDGDANFVHDYLHALVNNDPTINTLLIVSHMPLVSLLTEVLTINAQAELFNTGAMAMIECERASLKGRLVAQYQSLFS